MFQGVILDVDGTLVDSNDAHAQSWVDALAEFGERVPFEQVRRLIGMGSDKLLPAVTGIEADSPKGKSRTKRRGEIFRSQYLPRIRPFPQVRELLERMKQAGLRLAVASSAEKEDLKKLLKVAGVTDLIEDHTSSDDADRSKPDPDIVVAALKKLDLPAAATVMIGDTPYDVEAATKAGIATIAFRCGGWQDEDLKGAIAIYEDAAELLGRFEESPLARK